MNYVTSTSTALRSRPGTDPVFGQFGGVLRTTLRAVRLQWILYRAQRRKVPALDATTEMNAHMLRDIGAPDQWVARAAAGRFRHDWRGISFGVAVVFVAMTILGTATPTSAAEPAPDNAQGKVIAQPRMAGVFAGEFVDGAPVYRFPAVLVTGSRKEGTTGNPPPCRQARTGTAKDRA